MILTETQRPIVALYQKWRFQCKSTSGKLHAGARGVMVIVVGNGHGDTSSNSGRD